MFFKSIDQISLPRVLETARISLVHQNVAAFILRCWKRVDLSGSEEPQGFCLVLVIKILVEMGCDPQPCCSFTCPFSQSVSQPKMIKAQSVSGPMTDFKEAERNSQHSALKEQELRDWWCVGRDGGRGARRQRRAPKLSWG